MPDTTGQANLRKEYVDGAVKAVALANYTFKTLCQIDTSSAWTESYYRETNTELTGGTGSAVKGIPRLAAFPYGEVSWTKVSAIMLKYGMEGVVSYEDELLNNIPVIAREILRIGRAVSYAIDTQIEALLSASAGNSVAITAGYEWDAAVIANRDPIKNILDGIQTIRADNMNPLQGNGYLVMNGTDYTNLISNSKVINSPTFKSADVISNGVVGKICGLNIMLSEAVTADQCYIVIAKESLVWKQAMPLTVVQERTEGIKTVIRAFELGVPQLIAPNGVCKITNTRA